MGSALTGTGTGPDTVDEGVTREEVVRLRRNIGSSDGSRGFGSCLSGDKRRSDLRPGGKRKDVIHT